MEKTIRENEALHATVRLLLDRLKETKTAPPPTVSTFLNVLIDSAMSNADKKQGGERYKEVLSQMSTHFFLLCGPRAYNDLQGNLKKVLPSLSAVMYNIKRNKEVIVEGEFRWDKLTDFLDKRGYPREVRHWKILRAGRDAYLTGVTANLKIMLQSCCFSTFSGCCAGGCYQVH